MHRVGQQSRRPLPPLLHHLRHPRERRGREGSCDRRGELLAMGAHRGGPGAGGGQHAAAGQARGHGRAYLVRRHRLRRAHLPGDDDLHRHVGPELDGVAHGYDRRLHLEHHHHRGGHPGGTTPGGHHLPRLLDEEDGPRQQPGQGPGGVRDHGQRHQHLLRQNRHLDGGAHVARVRLVRGHVCARRSVRQLLLPVQGRDHPQGKRGLEEQTRQPPVAGAHAAEHRDQLVRGGGVRLHVLRPAQGQGAGPAAVAQGREAHQHPHPCRVGRGEAQGGADHPGVEGPAGPLQYDGAGPAELRAQARLQHHHRQEGVGRARAHPLRLQSQALQRHHRSRWRHGTKGLLLFFLPPVAANSHHCQTCLLASLFSCAV
mmetsp:Transcript_3447/g.8015  ORF Transcript_3447/g.8015 Transcript_3447/m.8015 type:complete len:371 (-) Transcript_3447:100-1212(-)